MDELIVASSNRWWQEFRLFVSYIRVSFRWSKEMAQAAVPVPAAPVVQRGRVRRALSATARGIGSAVRGVGRAASATGKAMKDAHVALGTAALRNDGMPIDIMGDRFFLDTTYGIAADINTRAAFDELYGVKTSDGPTINAIYKVFESPAPITDKGIIARIKGCNKKELELLQVAITKRITTIDRTIRALSNGSVVQQIAKYKRDRIIQLKGWITVELAARNAGTPPTLPTTTITYPPHYQALKEDTTNETRQHKHIFEAIMGIAYYLANPDFLIDSSDGAFSDKQAIVDKFEAVLELLDRGHLHDLVTSIRGTKGADPSSNAMNYFDRIRLKDVLREKTNTGASDEAIRQIGLPTMDEVMSNRVLTMMKLFRARQYIDASAVTQIEGALRDKNTVALMGTLGNVVKDISDSLHPRLDSDSRTTIRNLYASFTPVYNFYKRVYDPVFTFVEEKVVGAEFLKWPLKDMTRILQIGIDRYKREGASEAFGVYKILDVSSGVGNFIKTLQTASRSTDMNPSLREAFSKLSPRQILDDDVTRGFVNLTPSIRFLLFDQQFDIPRRADIEELLEEKVKALTGSSVVNNAKKKAAAATQARTVAAAAQARATKGGGSDDFKALMDFFTPNTVYMFVNHKDKKQGTDLNPRIIDASGTEMAQSSGLKYYKRLKQSDIIREPSATELRYVQLNIVILAISCMILFYKRLGDISR